jgi:GxxExxY protein
MKTDISKNKINELTYKVIGCAIRVHKFLGPGLLESVYHRCLFQEMRQQNIFFQSSLNVPVV